VNRASFRALALSRLKDAEVLLRNRRYGGAYYLLGYIVECALKACISRRMRRYEFPDRDLLKNIYTHKLTDLIKAAQLSSQLESEKRANKPFEVLWSVVLLWSEQSRYEKYTQRDATELYRAVTDDTYGVLQWIKRYW
jgi:HEPN domain-containing protein